MSQNLNSPTAFCYNLRNIKAIVLGADPSNFSDNGKTKNLTKVFGIGDGDPRYFDSIFRNLKQVDLNLENIYIDNIIQEYLKSETSKNEEWVFLANKKIKSLKNRLDKIDKTRKVPVLVTAEIICKVLLNDDMKLLKAHEFYSSPKNIPIINKQNKLERKIIPFYRHLSYSINKYIDYKIRVKEILNT